MFVTGILYKTRILNIYTLLWINETNPQVPVHYYLFHLILRATPILRRYIGNVKNLDFIEIKIIIPRLDGGRWEKEIKKFQNSAKVLVLIQIISNSRQFCGITLYHAITIILK